MALRKLCTLLTMLAIGAALAACGGGNSGGSSTTGSSSRTLHLAFFADIATADPDVFYDIEGDAITQSVYDGLVTYAPGTTKIVGSLAKSWKVSANGLTYTFNLRSAKFSDGSPFTSEAVKQSFERRTKVNQGPAYMLADVASYGTPSKSTFVVTLKQPNSAFLDLMASVWGPKVISPKVLASNSSDDAQKYLKTHTAGTGPFMLTKFSPGTGYVLSRNPNYWGTKPYFNQVDIAVQPDVSTQELELEHGSLDAILHGVPISSLDSLKSNSNVTVNNYPSLDTLTLAMNQTKPALASAAVRRAVVDALDVPTLVTSVFGDTATAMPDAYPAPLIPAGTSPNPHPYDTAQIKAALPAGLKLTVVYTPDSSGVERRFADLMRQRLATFGVDVTEQQVQLSVVYGYRDNTQKAADIYISTPAPDAATPDAWARILWYTKGGLNFFNYTNPAVDAKIDAGLRSDDQAQADQNYAEAGKLAVSDSGEVPIAQVSDVIATNKDITGMEHVPAYPWTLNLASLARK